MFGWPRTGLRNLCREQGLFDQLCLPLLQICALQHICADMLAVGKEQDVIGRAGLQAAEKRNAILPH